MSTRIGLVPEGTSLHDGVLWTGQTRKSSVSAKWGSHHLRPTEGLQEYPLASSGPCQSHSKSTHPLVLMLSCILSSLYASSTNRMPPASVYPITAPFSCSRTSVGSFPHASSSFGHSVTVPPPPQRPHGRSALSKDRAGIWGGWVGL